MMALSTGSQGSKVVQKPTCKRNVAAIPKSRSSESLDRIGQGMRPSHTHHATPQAKRPIPRGGPASAPNSSRDVSRVELLLAQKRERHTFCPVEETNAARDINKAIKQSSQWTDVNAALKNGIEISAGNAAYAIYRLGCLNCFASRKRRAELAKSCLVPTLLQTAASDAAVLDADSVVLILDGCARLKHEVPTPFPLLGKLAAAAEAMASSFESSQLPLILWSFSVLGFQPPVTLLAALERVLPHRVDRLTPQGVCLVLTGFQVLQHNPSQHILDLLAGSLRRMLPLITRSEVASCLEAFSAFNYEPPADLITAILDTAGQALHSDTLSGKSALSDPQYVHFTTPSLNGLAARQAPGSPPLAAHSNGEARINSQMGGKQEPMPVR